MPAGLWLGPAWRVTLFQLEIRLARHGVRAGPAAAGNETPDVGLAPARTSSGPTRKRGVAGVTGTRLQASHPTRPIFRASPMTQPLRRAVDTTAVLTGSLHTARWSPGPGQLLPGGQPDVSARRARDSRRPPP